MTSIAAVQLRMVFFALLLFAVSSALTAQKNTLSLKVKGDDENRQQEEQEHQQPTDVHFRPHLSSTLSTLFAAKDTSNGQEETARLTDGMALSTSASFLLQKAKEAMPMAELHQANVSSGSMADNVTHSSSEIQNTNVTSVILVGEGSNSTIQLISTNVTLPEEKLTTSLLEESDTNATLSTSELLNTSGSVADKLANYTSDVSRTHITSSEISNIFNSSSELAKINDTTAEQTVNASNSTSELSEIWVASNARTENVSTHRTLAIGTYNVSTHTPLAIGTQNVSDSSMETWEQNPDTESHNQLSGMNASQQAELINKTSESSAFDKNISHADSMPADKIQPDPANHAYTAQLNPHLSSQETEKHPTHETEKHPTQDTEKHPTQLTEEDYDYEIDEASLKHSGAKATDQVSEPGCPTCRMRAIDRHYRILQFKNQILSSIQITTIPNVTGVPIPKVPALTHLYEMDVDLMSDPPSGRRNDRTDDQEYDDDFLVKTERIFIGAKEAPLALHLNLTDTVYFPPGVHLFTSEIKSAHLWFYVRRSTNPPSSVTIDLIVSQAKPGQTFGTKKLLHVKVPKKKAHGWKRIDLTNTLIQWIKHPMTNFGLLLKAEDKSGNNLIVLPHPPDVDKGYEPCLDTKIIESRHNSRRRRSESLMCVENSTDTRCCRHPLIVGFAEFGWDWIIAPTHVNADYCTGECRLTMQDNTPYSWMNQQVPGTNSCCTPTKLSPLPLMYFDENMHIVYQILQNMKVEKCGCA